MTKIFEADTLDDAYKKISQSIDIPISQLDIEVVQTQTSGLFGLIKKGAILKVNLPDDLQSNTQQEPTTQLKQEPITQSEPTAQLKPKHDTKPSTPNDIEASTPPIDIDKEPQIQYKVINDETTQDIHQKLDKLFATYCLDVKIVKLHKIDDFNIYIKFDGEDSKILIGTKGFRYDSLSFMLHSWLKRKYDLELRLEILQYLESKQHKVAVLLEKFFEDVSEYGYATSVELSGQYLRIAIDLIQDRFPDKELVFDVTQKNRKTIRIDDRQDVL